MDIRTRERDGVTILDVSGKILLGEGDLQLREEIRNLLDEGVRKILLNLGEVTYIDSSGLGTLISSYSTAEQKGGKLKLYAITRKLQDLLAIAKLLTVFDAFDTEDEAIKSFA